MLARVRQQCRRETGAELPQAGQNCRERERRLREGRAIGNPGALFLSVCVTGRIPTPAPRHHSRLTRWQGHLRESDPGALARALPPALVRPCAVRSAAATGGATGHGGTWKHVAAAAAADALAASPASPAPRSPCRESPRGGAESVNEASGRWLPGKQRPEDERGARLTHLCLLST